MRSGVVLLAAGAGRRLGARKPKQFLSLNGRPLFMTPLAVFAAMPSVKDIVVVCSSEGRKAVESSVRRLKTKKPVAVVLGGAIRGESVRNGVKALSTDIDVVLVHDSARPLVTADIVRRVETAAKKTGAALAAWPLADTLKLALQGTGGQARRSFGGQARRSFGEQTRQISFVKKTIPRKNLWLAQTPQGFRRDVALKCLLKPSASATDDVELAQRKGFKVAIVDGAADNFKVTYPMDLKLCRLLA